MELLYDEVIGSIMGNILSEQSINHKIILKDYNDSDPAHKLYLNVAVIISDLSQQPIFINTTFLKLMKLKLRRRKIRKQLRRINDKDLETIGSEVISIDTIIDYVCNAHKIDRPKLTEINNEFYGGH